MGAKLPNFPIQSAAAIKLATEAAQAKCEELSGRGFYKVGHSLHPIPPGLSQNHVGSEMVMCCMTTSGFVS